MKNNRLLIIAGIATVILIIALIIGKKQGWIGKSDATEVSIEKVTKRTIVETVAASGKVQPEAEVKITPDVPGEIIELTVKEGDKVTAGQLLVRIDPDIQQSNVERLEAAMNTAKANLANAKSRKAQVDAQFTNAKALYERNKKLFEQKVISEQEMDAATSSFEVAKNEVEAAKQNVSGADFNVKSANAALQEAKKNLTRTTIFSPVNGTISKLSVEKGERVVGTSQMAGTEIMTIANLNEMEVNVDVNENDIVRVGVGDSAEIEVDAYIGRKFRGVVTSIANSANVTGALVDQVTNFEVKIRILQESYKDLVNEKQPLLSPFRPGMSATVEIRTKTAKDVLTVPIQAVTSRSASDTLDPEEKEKFKKDEFADADESMQQEKTIVVEKEEEVKECVFVLENGKAKLVYVKTGIQDNNYIEIVSGLEENTQVITAPYSQVSKLLKAGDEVQVVDEKELYGKKKK
ncbi:MAG: Macrolide export protein MacA [Bacteroidia bacterium]|nr:Macrolide export protein MacA [Bacteroidia bacterium]